jgi:oligopeptide/dipeptide ABC transporter ATP-binding protein
MSALIQVRDLHKWFPVRGSGGLFRKTALLRAVNGVNFEVPEAGTFGLVGESGSGKSTVAACILRLLTPDKGLVLFKGADLARLSGKPLSVMRRGLSVVFQDPHSSLDPRMTVKTIVGAPLRVNKLARGRELERKVEAILAEVGLGAEHLHRYPHEFSGGQRQRIAIARALITDPECIVLDEPTSALDVSVQAQILNLLHELQARRGTAYLLISHNLAVVRRMSGEIGVMYRGALVETGPRTALFQAPLHPYTRMLLDAAPLPDPERRLSPDVDAPWDVDADLTAATGQTGCAFAPLCVERADVCLRERPLPRQVDTTRTVTCHLHGAPRS